MTPDNSSEILNSLLGRSRRLGSDIRNTNYGGGNTSAKGCVEDPASGQPVEVMWVKGSGGDLGTLTPRRLSIFASIDSVPCGRSTAGRSTKTRCTNSSTSAACARLGAAPCIDTSMHALLEPAHVDHLHPDSVIAIAAAADGEELTKRCFGDEVAWVPWRRPGFELGHEVAALHEKQPHLKGVVLGGHGLTTWGDTSDSCEAASLDLIERAAEFLEREGRPDPLGGHPPRFRASRAR